MTQKEQIQQFNKKMIEDLQKMKKKEKEEGNLSNGRRRWFNQQIQKLKEKTE